MIDFPSEIVEVLKHDNLILIGSAAAGHYLDDITNIGDYDFMLQSRNDPNNQAVFNLSLVLENNGWQYNGKTSLGGLKLSKNDVDIDIFSGDLFTLPLILGHKTPQYLYYPKENKFVKISEA